MCWLVAAAVVVGVFGTPLDCWAAVDTDAPLRAFIAARQDVQTHCPALDVVPEGTGPARIAVEREWDRLEDLIASKLRANRDSRFEFTMKGLSVDIVPLQADTDLVSANLDGLGTVFVVQKRNGAFRPVWSIHDLGTVTIGAYPSLAAWSAKNATKSCQPKGTTSAACGPMNPDVARLPDDTEGRPRFYINASYHQAMGIEVGYQLSIWTWTGQMAVPALVGFYNQSLDVPIELQIRGQTLSLRTKDDFQTFYVTEPEPGRQLIWSISLAGTGAHDLGRKSSVPELDIVDELFERILEGKASSDLASAEARSVLEREMWKGIDAEGSGEVALTDALGELLTSSVRHSGSNTALCFASDNIAPLQIDMKPGKERLFVTHVHPLEGARWTQQPCKN